MNSENPWYDVKDRLPKDDGDVLVDFIEIIGDKVYHDYDIAYYKFGNWFTLDGEPICVANWMPLPLLPKLIEDV
jgi:hypothetical protein